MGYVHMLVRQFAALRLAFAATFALLAVALPQFASAASWWNPEYTYRTKIVVDLSPAGAGIADPVGRTPVLIRLLTSNFKFGDIKPDGSDLQIVAGDDKTPLKFHIEKIDAKGEVAMIWVDMPNLAAGGPTPIYLYYGNAKATGGADPKGTFGPEQVLVYHFAPGAAQADSTAYGNQAASAVVSNPESIIGGGARLDGTKPIAVAPSQTMATEAEGAYTMSAWIKPAPGGLTGVIYTLNGALEIGLENGVLYAASGGARTSAGQAIAADKWTHVAAVADGKTITVFVDGAPQGTVSGALPAASQGATVGGGAGRPGFVGEIDEIRAAKAALAPGQLRLAAVSEGLGAKLLSFDQPEENSEGGHAGYIGVLFASLTIDGWIVMGILGVMALISFWVMYSKIAYINQSLKADRAFIEEFDRIDPTRPIHVGTISDDKRFRKSPTARLFAIGREALVSRLKGPNDHPTLTPQQIAAIRGKLEGGLVRENEFLNRWIVLLTIAISGGPFLGLLGTVVGVMITFAAIAAAGDVNINSIAPGIAAALLATVAGLAVAIPSLFGYNYLLSRIEVLSSEMAIFIDDLEKRIAENYSPNPTTIPPQRIAA